jgi:hypothetical protein
MLQEVSIRLDAGRSEASHRPVVLDVAFMKEFREPVNVALILHDLHEISHRLLVSQDRSSSVPFVR